MFLNGAGIGMVQVIMPIVRKPIQRESAAGLTVSFVAVAGATMLTIAGLPIGTSTIRISATTI